MNDYQQLFVPSSWLLMKMIEAAEAKYELSRKAYLADQFESACAHNAAVVRKSREQNARRYVNCGDKP